MLPNKHLYSTLLGYINLGACVSIALPQMFLIWRRKSGKGVSLTMLWLWLVGDVASIIGTIVQRLLHTLIILGVINGLIDIALIWQCCHYARWEQFNPILNFLRIRQSAPVTSETPLSTHISPDPTVVTPESPTSLKSRWSIVLHTAYVLTVVGLSVMVWGVVVAHVRKTASLRSGDDGTDPIFSPAGAAFGWISMVIYSSSRYPQIYKNWKSKSCHNLSVWTFVLLVIFNATNICSIVIKSRSRKYIIVNLPWIVEPSVNVFLDLIIMGQFQWYRKSRYTGQDPHPISETRVEQDK